MTINLANLTAHRLVLDTQTDTGPQHILQNLVRMDLVIMDYYLIQTFLVVAEFLLISIHHNTVKMDSDSTDFHLSVPTLETTLDTTERLISRPLPACLRNRHGRLADRTAVVAL